VPGQPAAKAFQQGAPPGLAGAYGLFEVRPLGIGEIADVVKTPAADVAAQAVEGAAMRAPDLSLGVHPLLPVPDMVWSGRRRDQVFPARRRGRGRLRLDDAKILPKKLAAVFLPRQCCLNL